MTPLETSLCAMRAILDNVEQDYGMPGGDGVSEIRRTGPDTWVVEMLQEERADIWTYTLSIEDGAARITDVKKATGR
ncbi:hypothetical protein [Sagittula salina]|uniref:Uncharacterized protein n=1 Tax=Sagittula salina TaxID=2820268 RepID=A0A940S0P4_9RHOB|nr:hypothetical protein [Sagittula salina]MBP0483303.1 hypothetical protein [Sagittula salina]